MGVFMGWKMLDFEIKKLVFYLQDFPPAYFYMVFFLASTFFCYALAIFYAWKTWRRLKEQSVHMSTKTLAMQKQIGRVLFVQVDFLKKQVRKFICVKGFFQMPKFWAQKTLFYNKLFSRTFISQPNPSPNSSLFSSLSGLF